MIALKPTNDYIFKKIFGVNKNKDLLKDLLQAILTNLKIEKVQIQKDVSLERQHIQEKLGIMDITATLNDKTRVNIEMQVKDYDNTIDNVEAIRMIDNKYIQKAEDEFEYLTGDAEERRLAYLREKAIRDEAAGLKSAERKGMEKGIEKEKRQTAKKMLTKGIGIDIIIEVTGLTKEEIEKI